MRGEFTNGDRLVEDQASACDGAEGTNGGRQTWRMPSWKNMVKTLL